MSDPIGFIVLLNERGRWTDNWDGEVHTARAAGEKALAAATGAGYEAVLAVMHTCRSPSTESETPDGH